MEARREAEQIALLAGDPFAAFQVVERQLGVLVLRTQVLLSLCGIVITVTGFSGRAIAETSALARTSISAGIVVVLSSAVVAIGGVLRLRWLTQEIQPDPLLTLERAIRIREAKGRSLAVAMWLFVAGFSAYCLAIAQLLLGAGR